MKELAAGIAIMWLVSVITKTKVSAQGFVSILLMLLIAWGLGNMFFMVIK